uniref:Uncharacterized protein n=1 Tax=Arundo donax TaxID=35708 RepID=A0A0A9CF18_ARUDO
MMRFLAVLHGNKRLCTCIEGVYISGSLAQACWSRHPRFQFPFMD